MIELEGFLVKATFDGRIITITRQRGSKAGYGVKSIPLSSITAVQLKPPSGVMPRGWLELSMPGALDLDGKTKIGDALERENVIVFLKKHHAAAEAFRDAIVAALTER